MAKFRISGVYKGLIGIYKFFITLHTLVCRSQMGFYNEHTVVYRYHNGFDNGFIEGLREGIY